MNYFIDGFKNYFNFEGRTSRKEYWMFMLFYFIFLMIASMIDDFIGKEGRIVLAFQIALIIPRLAILARRLHDIDKSGWIILVELIPFGVFYTLYLSCLKGTEGENRFGPINTTNKSKND